MNRRLRIAATIIVSLAGLIGLAFLSTYYYLKPTLPDVAVLRDVRLQVPLRVYTRDGRQLAQIGEQRRVPVAWDQIPPVVVQALLAAEDDRSIDARVPDLVVYLQAPVDVLVERSTRRGIPSEQLIERRYLERLVESYSRFFLEYDVAPVLTVNAAEIDLVGSDADFGSLLAEVVRARKGRHFFNPMKSLL